MSKQIYLPEYLYHLDPQMNRSRISIIYENSDTITGKVIRLDSENELLEVYLGGDIIGTMSYEDSTIYPIYNLDGNLSPNIYTLVGKRIRAKIKGLENNQIFLSRKENMLETLEYLKSETNIHFATITNFSKMSAFMDIGSGITGRTYGKNFSCTKYNNIRDIGIKKWDTIPVTITEFDEDTNLFCLSRVATLKPITDIYNEGDVVTCTVFEPLGDYVGYYVCIDKKYSGICDSEEIELKYGDEITAIIKKISTKGPRLDLVEII